MRSGFSGTFVISWGQTEIDGLEAAPSRALVTGAAWSWRGDLLRVDGPNDRLCLDGATGPEELRRRAARKVRRLVGHALDGSAPVLRAPEEDTLCPDRSFVVTDGAQSFAITVIETGFGRSPLLMFVGALPPRDRELWVVHTSFRAPEASALPLEQPGVICFSAGTQVRTPDGARHIETLRPGDLVQTRDNGVQAIQWVGSRRMTGARLFAMPDLRPIRFRAGALGIERPDQELLVSPAHQMLITGAVARDLFNTDEVLIAARDLINGTTITVDLAVREVTYVHLMFDGHQIIWANNVETESFHPVQADFGSLSQHDRAELADLWPGLEEDPHLFGAFARRCLTRSEAAIWRHAA